MAVSAVLLEHLLLRVALWLSDCQFVCAFPCMCSFDLIALLKIMYLLVEVIHVFVELLIQKSIRLYLLTVSMVTTQASVGQ